MPEREELPGLRCGYCNAPWSGEMLAVLEHTSAGCDSCGYGASAEISVEIG